MLARDELPFLDEPPSVELANTLYGDGRDAFDFLGDATVDAWLHHAPRGSSLGALGSGGVAQLRGLRDAVSCLFDDALYGRRPRPRTLSAINRASAACVGRVLLHWDGRPVRRTSFEGPEADRLVAVYALDAIDVATGARWHALRRCAAPDCTMLFVQQHRRRRFCHPSCSQRVRQAAYDQRQRQRR